MTCIDNNFLDVRRMDVHNINIRVSSVKHYGFVTFAVAVVTKIEHRSVAVTIIKNNTLVTVTGSSTFLFWFLWNVNE
jgi:hypothetical protein